MHENGVKKCRPTWTGKREKKLNRKTGKRKVNWMIKNGREDDDDDDHN